MIFSTARCRTNFGRGSVILALLVSSVARGSAQMSEATGYATVKRLDRRRAVTVTADMDTAAANPEEVMRELRPALALIEAEHPGVRILERGRQQDMAERTFE